MDIVIHTTDGGQNWDTIDFNYKVVDDYNDVMCNSDGSVYIFEREIIYSSDKGQTWSLLVEDAPLGTSGNFSNSGTTLWGVGWGGTQEPCRVKSTDDGETWTSFTIPDEDNGGIRV